MRKEVIFFTTKKRDNRWGWFVEFKKPLECTWSMVNFTRIYMNNNSHNTGFQMRQKWEGSAFLYSLNKMVKWDFNSIKSLAIKGMKITKVEKFISFQTLK